jgi:PAS domain S-box-containing protein
MTQQIHRGTILFIISCVLGAAGVMFARQFDTPFGQGAFLAISVALPLFVGFTVISRLQTKGFERSLMTWGLVLLAVGAVISFQVQPQGANTDETVSTSVTQISKWLGVTSLFLGMIVVMFSVVRREEVVGELGQRFQHLADRMGEGFVLTDAAGRVLSVNRRFESLTGLRAEELMGRTPDQLPIDLHIESMLQESRTSEERKSRGFQMPWVMEDKEYQYWVTGTSLLDKSARTAGTLVVLRDVTEQHQLSVRLERYAQGLQELVEDRTQQLRTSEQRVQDLLLNMNEGFLTLNSTFKVQYVNARLCELLQMKMEDILGADLFQFVDIAGRGRLLNMLQSIESRASLRRHEEFNLVRNDSALVSVMASASAIHDGSEPDLQYSIVITDVSELKAMQAQLEERADELEARNEELKILDRAKDSFLSNVSHELRTPLSTVRGYMEMLESGSLGEVDDKQSGALSVVGRNLQRLGHIIDEMIEFSRMEIRGIQLNLSLFSPQALVDECVNSIMPLAAERAIHLSHAGPEDFPAAWGDRQRVAQALTILLANAVKFSGEEGRVRVELKELESAGLAISVKDNGIGIDPAYQERVFDKFYQVDSTHTRSYEGTGIGLSIAKTIVEAHGGTVDLDSTPQVGSTFVLNFPGAVFSRKFDSEDQQSLRALKVLVVDAEEDARTLLTSYLEQCGCQVQCASSGYEALRVISEEQPHVIVMDERLPELSGLDTLARIRQEFASDPPHVVLLIREGETETDTGVTQAQLLPMPFDTRQLCDAVRGDATEIGGDSTEPDVAAGEDCGRVLIVDSDPDFLHWFQWALETSQIACHAAGNTRAAIAYIADHPVDAVFLELENTEAGAPSPVKRFRAALNNDDTPIILTSGFPARHVDAPDVAGILRKPFSVDEALEILQSNASRVG